MAMGKPRDPRKEREWRQRMRDWQRSGLSVQAFCAELGLSQTNFYAWRHELDYRDAERTAFVPVKVVGEAALAPSPAESGLEVVVAGGRTIRVVAGFDPTTLRRLLAVLEEQPPC